MAQQAPGSIAIRLEGTEDLFWAQPRPEDQERLAELLRGGTVEARLAGGDVEGHAQSAELTFDVEGHALTLRLPSAADAAELRRRLALGAVAATLVVAGSVAALQGVQPTSVDVPAPGPAAPAAPFVQPGARTTNSDIGIMDQSAQQAAQDVVAPQVQSPSSTTSEPGTHRTINDPYSIDLGPAPVTAPAQPAAPATQSGYQNVASDVGAMDQSAQNAAAQQAGGSDAEEDTGIPKAGQQPELR
jgi:hypothetical protein